MITDGGTIIANGDLLFTGIAFVCFLFGYIVAFTKAGQSVGNRVIAMLAASPIISRPLVKKKVDMVWGEEVKVE